MEEEEKKITTELDNAPEETAEVDTTVEEVAAPAPMKFKDRIKSKYPDMPSETDEDMEAMYTKYADDTDKDITEMNDSMKVLNDLLVADEDFREIATDMVVSKAPLRVVLARHFSQEDLIPQEGDDDYEEYQKTYNERLEKGKKKLQDMDVIEKNEQESIDAFDKFSEEKGLDEEQKNKFNDFIGEIFSNLLYKKITPDMLETFYKGMNYDSAVEEASATGEIKGRNENIEAVRMKKDGTDGIPDAVVGRGKSGEPNSNPVSFLGRKRNNI